MNRRTSLCFTLDGETPGSSQIKLVTAASVEAGTIRIFDLFTQTAQITQRDKGCDKVLSIAGPESVNREGFGDKKISRDEDAPVAWAMPVDEDGIVNWRCQARPFHY